MIWQEYREGAYTSAVPFIQRPKLIYFYKASNVAAKFFTTAQLSSRRAGPLCFSLLHYPCLRRAGAPGTAEYTVSPRSKFSLIPF